MIAMGSEIVIGLFVTTVIGGAGWGFHKLRRHWALPDKVDAIDAKVEYVARRIDNLTDALISGRE
jgi:hypothetical protein